MNGIVPEDSKVDQDQHYPVDYELRLLLVRNDGLINLNGVVVVLSLVKLSKVLYSILGLLIRQILISSPDRLQVHRHGVPLFLFDNLQSEALHATFQFALSCCNLRMSSAYDSLHDE